MTARTLVLLRHAKAETPGDDARLRPPADRAGRARRRRGRRLAGRRAAASRAWCSARRRPGPGRPGRASRSRWPRRRRRRRRPRCTTSRASTTAAGPRSSTCSGRCPDDGAHGAGGRPQPDHVRSVRSAAARTTDDDGSTVELKTAGLAVHRAEGPWSGTEPGSMRAGRARTPPAADRHDEGRRTPLSAGLRRVGSGSQNASSARSIRSRVVFSMIRRSEPIRGSTSRAKNRAAATLPS